ncbi:MAG: hypothetical protein K2L30_09275 [Duncaniella sp.]|nr:hypothetical protein [Duncaniella sp.]
MLNQLRFYLRNEQRLISEGWLSESDFLRIVEEIVREYASILLIEE